MTVSTTDGQATRGARSAGPQSSDSDATFRSVGGRVQSPTTTDSRCRSPPLSYWNIRLRHCRELAGTIGSCRKAATSRLPQNATAVLGRPRSRRRGDKHRTRALSRSVLRDWSRRAACSFRRAAFGDNSPDFLTMLMVADGFRLQTEGSAARLPSHRRGEPLPDPPE